MSNQIGNKTLSLAQIVPTQTRIRLVAVWLIVIAFLIFGHSLLSDTMSSITATIAFIILISTIIGAAFGVVREADELARKLGEPYGTIILVLSIEVIEVILILAVMMGPGENPSIGKDSVFSIMMIIMNLVTGLAILLGGLKFGEQEYSVRGAKSYLGMIVVLGGLGLILPNFIEGAGGGMFSSTQAIVLSFFIVLLYVCFLSFQLKRYGYLYAQPQRGLTDIPFKERYVRDFSDKNNGQASGKKIQEIWIRTGLLIAMVLPVVLLSHNMAVVVDYGIRGAGLPLSLGGIMIALIVYTPESITAVKAALNNEFQRAVNLSYGAFLSTIGLTVPTILISGLITGKTVLFGITPVETLLFAMTLLLTVMTFFGKRSNPMAGIMHLVLFAVYIMLIFNP